MVTIAFIQLYLYSDIVDSCLSHIWLTVLQLYPPTKTTHRLLFLFFCCNKVACQVLYISGVVDPPISHIVHVHVFDSSLPIQPGKTSLLQRHADVQRFPHPVRNCNYVVNSVERSYFESRISMISTTDRCLAEILSVNKPDSCFIGLSCQRNLAILF